MKNIFAIILFAVISFCVNAQDHIDRFIATHAHKKGDDKVVLKLNRVALSFAAPFLKPEDRKWLRKVRMVDIFVLEGTRNNLSPDFKLLSKKLSVANYEPLMMVRSEGDKADILMKTDRHDNVREVVMLVNDSSEDAVLIRVKGKFNPNDLEKLQEGIAKTNLHKEFNL